LAAKVGEGGKTVDLAGTGSAHVTLLLAQPTSAPAGTPVALGMRPEHLLPTPDGVLEFDIELAEPLGADTLLHGRFGEARELVTVRQGGHVLAKPGEKRRFSIGATRLHLFDSLRGPHKLRERRIGFAVEWLIVLAATVIAGLTHLDATNLAGHVIVVMLAFAMGIQNAMVRAHGVPDLATNVMTVTFTAIIADSK